MPQLHGTPAPETMESVSTLATALAFLRGEHRRRGFAAVLALPWRHEWCWRTTPVLIVTDR
ncbi:MAG TPA: hypothetical protein VF043_04505 [Ktedonobacteraceae bacterium]